MNCLAGAYLNACFASAALAVVASPQSPLPSAYLSSSGSVKNHGRSFEQQSAVGGYDYGEIEVVTLQRAQPATDVGFADDGLPLTRPQVKERIISILRNKF